MTKKLILCAVPLVSVLLFVGWLYAQAPADPTVDGFRTAEVSSVADAIEQLYGTQNYMSQDMRPLFKTKFAGPAVTVFLKREEHKEGSAATKKMIEAIDNAPAGSVFVLVAEDGLKYGTLGGLMGTTLKYRGVAGAIVDGSIRDLPQLQRLQFPVYSRGVAPGTTINHYRAVGVNVPVVCGGVKINPGDIVAADEDGVVVVPRLKAADVLKKSQELDFTEHATYPFIEKFKSLAAAVEKFGRL